MLYVMSNSHRSHTGVQNPAGEPSKTSRRLSLLLRNLGCCICLVVVISIFPGCFGHIYNPNYLLKGTTTGSEVIHGVELVQSGFAFYPLVLSFKDTVGESAQFNDHDRYGIGLAVTFQPPDSNRTISRFIEVDSVRIVAESGLDTCLTDPERREDMSMLGSTLSLTFGTVAIPAGTDTTVLTILYRHMGTDSVWQADSAVAIMARDDAPRPGK